MKKSKFLKKSLAMLLAVMLVVAMIPLSAAAAEGDPTIYVDDQLATLSGTTYSVTAPNDEKPTTVTITKVQADVDMVAVDKNGDDLASLSNIDLTKSAAKSGEVYTLTLRTETEQADDSRPITKTYTLNITVKEVVESGDATIASLTNDEGNKLADVTNWTITDNTITIYTGFGKSLADDVTIDNFVAANKDATKVLGSFNAEHKATLTVTAQNGSTKTYTVELKSEAGITAFTVPEQTEASKIEGTEITIKVPYGYETEKVVPTFTLADGILALTSENTAYNQNVVTSGETEVEFTSNKATLYAWTDKDTSVEVTVTLEVPDQNPEAVLKTVKVGGSNEVTVEGTTVSVEMPAGFDFAEDGPVNVTGTVSANADVSISAQGNSDSSVSDDGEFTLSDVRVTGKTFVISVKSEDGKTTTNYTVNLTAAASAEANLNDFSVKYMKDDKEGDTYTASNGTLTLPYSAKAELGNYKVYAQVSTGATISPSITNGDTSLNDVGMDEKGKITLAVTGSDGSKQTYTITVKYENGKSGKALSSAEMVGTNEEAKITEDNTYTATKGTAKLGDKTVNTIKVTLPYSFKVDTDKAYLSELVLSDGASAYLSNATEIALVGNDDDKTPTEFDFNGKVDAVDDEGVLTDTKATAIYVLSEEEVVDAKVSGSLDASDVTTEGTVYYVYAVKADPAEGNSITSISSTLDENVTARLSGTTITITVPGSYADATVEEFTLNFNLSKMASLLTAADQTAEEALKSDNGNEDNKDEATKFAVNSDGELLVGGATGTAITGSKLYVKSEKGEVKTYTVKTVINEKETGAELTAVSVNGIRASISGKTVTVNLPFGTNLYPVKLGLTASKMAEITIVGEGLYNEDTNYDLNKEIKISVKSEDGKTTNVYTLKATTADQFSDVDTNDWYYNNVMRAVELGILSGYSDGTFKPMNNITRRDFAIMLAQSLGHDNDEKATSPFKDVADTDYGVSSIAYLYENEITVGDSNGNFNPDANITRQEAAIMLVKAFEATGTSSDLYADDAQIASWAKSFVYTAKAAGLMKGDDHNEFNPTDRLTRAEAASAMVNAVDN